jgi:hypothetical protein
LNGKPIYPKLPRVAPASVHATALVVLAAAVAVPGAAGAAAAPVTDADMRAATERLLAEVAAVRRIAPRGALERRVETRAQAEARRAAELGAAAADPALAARARLWERLGLIPAGADAARALGPADAGPVAEYDPLGRRLSVPDWIPLAEQRPALAHALAHALADQRFGVRDLLKIDLEGRHHLDGDAERARLALVEGDAALTALEVDDPRGALEGRAAVAALAARVATPPSGQGLAWPRAVAGFAHGAGLAFVARVRARQPWSAVDALWASPPQSSEQVLHPEKYVAREAPVPVPPPAPLRAFAGGWREDASDVLGELGARVWLAAAVPDAVAERAAAGWGGDRATLFVPAAPPPDGGASAAGFVVWSTVWDDPTDAEDFARAAGPVLAALAGDRAPADDDPHRFVARGAEGVYALAWRGGAVTVLLGAPEAALASLDELLPAPAKAPARKGPSPNPLPAARGEGHGRR